MRYFVALLYVAAAFGTEVTGHVRLIQGAPRGHSTVIVYAESLEEHVPPKPGHYELQQRGKTFIPHVLAIPVGSSVTFPNEDPIFHNVFSLSRPAPFDLGLYRAGASKTRVFTEPGIYRVFCNIHPQMSALLLVLPTSWITETKADGAYRMDLPPGRYRVTAWSERSQAASVQVDIQSSSCNAPDIVLDESKFVEIPHKNKYGQDYPASAYEQLKQ